MVKEIVDSYKREKLIEARKMAGMEQAAKELAPNMVLTLEENLIHINVRRPNQGQRFMNRVLKKIAPSIGNKMESFTDTERVGYVCLDMGRMTVTDREYYELLKKVAEGVPWIETIEKDWNFALDEDISVEEEDWRKARHRPVKVTVEPDGDVLYESGSEGMPYSEATKKKQKQKNKTSEDLEPRYEKIEHKGDKMFKVIATTVVNSKKQAEELKRDLLQVHFAMKVDVEETTEPASLPKNWTKDIRS
jgi:hypothetical protein